MKKTIILAVAFLVLAMGSVMAAPSTGFHLDNDIAVTGDWVWDGHWFMPVEAPVTAVLEMSIDSSLATQAQFQEVATFGAPWKLTYGSVGTVNAPVRFKNVLTAITVNPPDTTPGVAWTKISFAQQSVSEFSASALSVNGYGNIIVDSRINMDSYGQQSLNVKIN